MSRLHINPDLQAALQDACIALGGHPMQKVLNRIRAQEVDIDQGDVEVIKDYIRRIEVHTDEKFPNHDEDDLSYDPEQEDCWLDERATYRDKLAYFMASAVGDDFLLR